MKASLLLLLGIAFLANETQGRGSRGKWIKCNWCIGGLGCGRRGCSDKVCWHNGISYQPGQSFRNKCNWCRCGSGNRHFCTRMSCYYTQPQCNYRGYPYFRGESVRVPVRGGVCKCNSSGGFYCSYRKGELWKN